MTMLFDLDKIQLVGLVHCKSKLIACRALKEVNESYVREVLRRANLSDLFYKLPRWEVGHAVTDPRYQNRGLSSTLLKLILANWTEPGKIISTSANPASIHMLTKYGFQELGEYPSMISNRVNKVLVRG